MMYERVCVLRCVLVCVCVCVSVVIIDLRYNLLNYNYLWLKPQLLSITITQILRL